MAKCQVRGAQVPYLKCYSVASTGGNIKSTDIGKLITKSSNRYGLALGSTDYQNLVGYLAVVQSTGVPVSSTTPFYVEPFITGLQYEMSYSTLYSTAHPSSTDIGKYVGLSTAATIAGAKISMGTLANSPAGASATVFRINGFSTARRMVYIEAPVSIVSSTASGLGIKDI
jgi:hypothetical protein